MKALLLIISIFILSNFSTTAQVVVFEDNYGSGITSNQFGSTFANFWSVSTAESRTGTSSLRIAVGGSGALYSGGRLEAATNQNLTGYNALTFWVKASRAATLNSVGFGNSSSGGAVFSSSLTNLPLTTTWTKITLPIPAPSKLTAEKGMFWVSEAANDAGGGAYNIFVDDINFENTTGVIGTPTASIPASSVLGFATETFSSNASVTCVFPINSVNQTQACSMAYLDLTSGDAGIATINALGTLVTAVGVGVTTISGVLNGTAVTGGVTVTVFSPAVAPSPPLTPAPEVKSLFSDTYTNATVNTWSVNTSRATVSDAVVGGNTFKKYFFVGTAPATNYCQIQFLGANAVNATGYTYLHIDAFTPNMPATSTSPAFQLKLVDYGADNAAGGTAANADLEHNINLITAPYGPFTSNTWVSFDIPLSSFTTIGSRRANINQILLTGTGGATIYIDNVVFSNAATLLPVSLVSFDVVKKNSFSILKWTIASESNNKGFYIQRSVDNAIWEEISFVGGAGNSTNVKTYSYQDNKPIKGKNFYRIKQVDYDGKNKLSGIRVLDFSNEVANVLSVYPNPAKGNAFVEFGEITSANAFLELITNDGKVAKSFNITKAATNTVFPININGLAKGMYLLRVTDQTKTYVQRLFIH
jgi:hypothetical protein